MNTTKGVIYFSLFIWLLSANSFTFAVTSHHIKILYFYSESCTGCIAAEPLVIAFGKEYDVEGFRYGDGNLRSLPFPVKVWDAKIAKEKYGVNECPTLVVLVDGVSRQKIAGASDVQDAKTIIRALADGAMTVSEAARSAGEGEITITGWIASKGAYFKDAKFSITDRATEMPITAWLPLEAMKSPFRTMRPRIMSDVIGKPVVLRGIVERKAEGSVFRVKEEIPID